MSRRYKVTRIIGLLVCLAGCKPDIDAEPVATSTPYLTSRAGAFHVGGELVQVQDANVDAMASGTVWANQLLVRYFLPNTPQPNPPIVMMPGYGLASDIYLETPDGREGWAMQFVQAGYPVYLVEPANSTRAGINPEILNAQIKGREGPKGQLFTWAQELTWTRFGFGSAEGQFFPDSQMPKESFDQLVKMFTPTLVEEVNGISMITYGLEANLKGLRELSEKIGPFILLVHSATGVPGFTFTTQHPEMVLAVIDIEPVGCPAAKASEFPDLPVLSLFADHMEVREQMVVRQKECQTLTENLQQRGIAADLFALPEMGIRGNSHLMMSELNSAELAAIMIQWMQKNRVGSQIHP